MVLATTERCGGGNLQKLNYGSFGKPLSPSVYDIRRERFLHSAATFPFCPRRQTVVVAEMFNNLTMDLPERLPALLGGRGVLSEPALRLVGVIYRCVL